jgi:lipoprotein-releasing system permease protein
VNNWAPFEWIAAGRFLREGRMQSIAIVVGVSIGVGVVVFMSAALSAQMTNIIQRVLSAQAHIVLLPPKEVARPLRGEPGTAQAAIVQKPFQRVRSIDQWQRILRETRDMPAVSAAAPSAAGSVLALRGEASRAVTLVGVEPAAYFDIVPLPDKLASGTARLGAEDIVIGTELAADLGVVVGDKLRIVANNGAAAALTVTGLVDLGSKGANQRTAYVALKTAQALLGLTGGASSIDVKVRDIYAAEDVAQALAAANGVQADSWIVTNSQFFIAINAQRVANTAIRVFVSLAIAFGIAAVLIVSVVQKSREIGILRAMGASQGQILRVFLLEGAALGLAGSVFGCVIATAAIALWERLVVDATGVPLLPIGYDWRIFAGAAVLATVTGLASAVWPALRGARLDPVVAIRG